MCGRLSILGLAAVVIVTVYKDTKPGPGCR